MADALSSDQKDDTEWPAWLCANTNIIAIEILKGIYEAEKLRGPETSLDWEEICENPIALPLIEQAYNDFPNRIEHKELAGNSAAYDLLMEVKSNHPANFNWGNFSANSRIGTIITDKYLDEAQMDMEDYFMLHDWEKLDWAKVSSNRSTYVLDYLFKSVPHSLINIGSLSGNPNLIAINFLKKRIEFEKGLSAEELGRLQYHEKIDWFLLSGNYAAFYLLYDNMDKISWEGLSPNESAIPLIKNRIRVEEKLIKESNVRQAERDREIAKLNTRIEDLEYEIRDKMNRDVLLEYPKLMMENEISELKERIESFPHIENDFLFETNKLSWPGICTNSKAIKLLEDAYKKTPKDAYNKTPQKIHLKYLFANPSIFVLNHGDPSYPSNNSIRFRSSSGNTKDNSSDNKPLYKPGAKSHSAKKASSMKSPLKPRAMSLPTKKASSMKISSLSKKTNDDMMAT